MLDMADILFQDQCFNTWRLEENGWHLADDNFKQTFLSEKFGILIKISVKCVHNGLNNNKSALVQVMAWGWSGVDYHLCTEQMNTQPMDKTWWRHQMETFSALLALCAGNSPVPGEFPSQRPVTRSFDVFFDLCLNKWLSKQSGGWWFETPSHSLWRHCNDYSIISDSMS